MLNLATKLAESSMCSHKHGAVIVKSGRVLAVGVNKLRNNPRYVPSDRPNRAGTIFSVHAEIDALSRVVDSRGATVYISRVSQGREVLSRPCENCLLALHTAGIKSVCYTT